MTQVPRKSLADRLRWARRRRGYSQIELARLGGMSPPGIGNIEQGKSKTIRRIIEIAFALRVRPEWLATGSLPIAPKDADPSAYDIAEKIALLSEAEKRAVLAMVDAFRKPTDPRYTERPIPQVRETVN